MSDDNKKISKEMIVGAFVCAVFVGLVFFTIVLSGFSFFGAKKTQLFIEFDKVGGLRRHDSVIVRGMPVGQVKALSLREDGVLVTVDLTEPVTIREGYTIRAESTSLLGGMQLVVDTGSGDVIEISESSPLVGLPPENVMENANELVTDLRGSLNDGGILTNLEAIVADVRDITATIRSGNGTVGKLLSEDNSLYNDLAMTVSNLNEITSRLERGEGTVGRLLSSDDAPYNHLTNFVANLDIIGARLERGEGTIGRLLSPDDPMATDLAETFESLRIISGRLERGEGVLGRLLSPDDPMAANLADTIENFKKMSDRIEKGEGLLGQLMRDDGEVTIQVNGILKDGRDLLDDMRETSPVSTFSSMFMGAF